MSKWKLMKKIICHYRCSIVLRNVEIQVWQLYVSGVNCKYYFSNLPFVVCCVTDVS